jgi:hypothetical protein
MAHVFRHWIALVGEEAHLSKYRLLVHGPKERSHDYAQFG